MRIQMPPIKQVPLTSTTRHQRDFFRRRALLLKLGLAAVVGIGFNYSIFHNLTIQAQAEPVVIAAPKPATTAPNTPAILPGAPGTNIAGVTIATPVQATAGSTRNHYTFGNCTYYVATKRAIPSGWGNARTWFGRAQAAGYKTGNLPAVGAIAWTPMGYYGHVAIVEQVNGDQVLVSEMNYERWNRVDRRWVGARSFQYIY